MSQTLSPGANAPLPTDSIGIRITSSADIDTAAYRLAANGKVRGDGDMVFYGQTQSDDASVQRSGSDRDSCYTVHLQHQPDAVERIALAYSGNQPAGRVDIHINHNGQTLLDCCLDTQGRSEKAMILGECYRRNGQWKFRFVAQGFNGGLKPLSEHFGVEIADDAAPASPPPGKPAPAAAPPTQAAAAPTLSLSKITLSKTNPSVSLQKRDNFGDIRINLNWNRAPAPQQSGGFLSGLFHKNKGIDLDLGAFIRLQDGRQDVVQALGGNFGNLAHAPFLRLRGDDRTGQVSEGEWMDINGSQWQNIREILIYAFIYEGVPSWNNTDGVVTLYVQGQEIETRLTEGDRNRNMCAIARLINDSGSIRVERINRYFTSHKDMDQAFGWGFRWTAGSK